MQFGKINIFSADNSSKKTWFGHSPQISFLTMFKIEFVKKTFWTNSEHIVQIQMFFSNYINQIVCAQSERILTQYEEVGMS